MSTTISPVESENIDPAGGEGIEFRCLFCDAVYDHEWLTRVHIIRAADDPHKNHDGFMPETKVKVVSKEGDSTTVTRTPDEIDVQTLEPGDLPASLSEKRKRILLIAAYNPHIDTYTELHERVEGVFTERGLGSVSYQTVNRAVQEFFLPTDDDEDASIPAKERYADLTEKQQQLIDAYLDNPSASYAGLADKAGTSRSYPAQILNKYETLIEDLQEERNTIATTDDEPETTDPPSSTSEEKTLDADKSAGTSTTETADDTNDDSPVEDSDGPITTPTARVMSATPYDSRDPSGSLSSESGAKSSATDGAESDSQVHDDDKAAETDETAVDTVDSESDSISTADNGSLREGVEEVKERVAFLRRIAERQASASDSTQGITSQLAVVEEIETELDRLLESDA